jgi:hypothetical protein
LITFREPCTRFGVGAADCAQACANAVTGDTSIRFGSDESRSQFLRGVPPRDFALAAGFRKSHAIVDSKGRPLNFTVTGGQVHGTVAARRVSPSLQVYDLDAMRFVASLRARSSTSIENGSLLLFFILGGPTIHIEEEACP